MHPHKVSVCVDVLSFDPWCSLFDSQQHFILPPRAYFQNTRKKTDSYDEWDRSLDQGKVKKVKIKKDEGLAGDYDGYDQDILRKRENKFQTKRELNDQN